MKTVLLVVSTHVDYTVIMIFRFQPAKNESFSEEPDLSSDPSYSQPAFSCLFYKHLLLKCFKLLITYTVLVFAFQANCGRIRLVRFDVLCGTMLFLVSPVLKPVSDLKFSHFQASSQQRALVACQILLAGKYLVQILELTLGKMTAISPLPFKSVCFQALFCLGFHFSLFVLAFI